MANAKQGGEEYMQGSQPAPAVMGSEELELASHHVRAHMLCVRLRIVSNEMPAWAGAHAGDTRPEHDGDGYRLYGAGPTAHGRRLCGTQAQIRKWTRIPAPQLVPFHTASSRCLTYVMKLMHARLSPAYLTLYTVKIRQLLGCSLKYRKRWPDG